MISNKAKTGIAPIDFNKVCNIVATDLKEKFSDFVLSVGKVKHKVNHSVLTLIINFKRKGPKNQTIDADTIGNIVEYLVADLKCNMAIPHDFAAHSAESIQKQFTTIITINLKTGD